MKNFLFILLIIVANHVSAQTFVSDTSNITFFSSAPLEDIEAFNTKAKSAYNTANNQIAFSVPITGFQFKKSLMQEHFNENYLESDKYPKSTFKGTVEGFELGKGSQEVKVKGKMTIHGVEKDLELQGTMEEKGGKLYVSSTFNVKLEDYNVEIPKVVFEKIAEVVEVKVYFEYNTKK